jgi:hypothetical protein
MLASRGKGKKVRFSGGTTFPAVMTIVCVAMLGLVAYSKVSVPGEETGAPQPGDDWVAAYAFRVCDEEFALTGTPDEVVLDASTGDPVKLGAGELATDRDGIIHYHPLEGGATGRRAGCVLDVQGEAHRHQAQRAEQRPAPLPMGYGATGIRHTPQSEEPSSRCASGTTTLGKFAGTVADLQCAHQERHVSWSPSLNDKDFEIRAASACTSRTIG